MTATTTATDTTSCLRKAFIITAFVTFTVLLHVTFPSMGGSGLRLPFNATVWMGFALMVAIAMWPATRGVIRYSAFHKGLGLLLLALWTPFLWSWNEASLLALPRMLTVTAGAILLLGISQLQLTRRDWWWIGMAILISALLETAYGYVQLYLMEPGNWVGYNPAPGRPYGIFQQVNVMASFLVTGLMISAWLFGEARHRLEASITLLAPLLMPALILVIQSRTGWLAALITVPMVLAHLWHLDRTHFRAWGAALAAGCVLAAIVWWAPWAEASTAAKAVGNPGERLPVYLHSLRMIAEEPLSGWGYGRFHHDFLHSFADWRAALPVNQPIILEPIITGHYTHPHNELLLWGIEGGLFPVAAMLVFASWVTWRLWRHGPQGERLLFTALLFPLTLHAMTELPFYHSLGHWLVFLLLLGMIAGVSHKTQISKNRYTFGIKAATWLAIPLVWIFMTTHLQALWQVKSFLEGGGRNAGTLARVINPLGIPHDLEFLVMSHQLSAGIALDLASNVETYRQWAEEEATLMPDPELYRNLSLTYENTPGKDGDIQHRFEHLYPDFVQHVDKKEEAVSESEPVSALNQ